MYKQIKVSEGVWADLKKMDGSMDEAIKSLLKKREIASFEERYESQSAAVISLVESLNVDVQFKNLTNYIDRRLTEIEHKIDKINQVDILDVIDRRQSEPKPIPKELEGLQPDELPECCQEAIQDGELGPLCSHWKMTYNNYGQTDYKNTLTGRFMSDPIYNKYV